MKSNATSGYLPGLDGSSGRILSRQYHSPVLRRSAPMRMEALPMGEADLEATEGPSAAGHIFNSRGDLLWLKRRARGSG